MKSKIRRFKRSLRAVSPVIAVLLMIVIAVAASLFAYSWVTGYLDFLTVKVDQGVQVQTINWNNETQSLTAYAQNVGPSDVTIANVYVDDVLDINAQVIDPIASTEDWVIPSGDTRMIVSTGVYTGADNQVTVKLTTVDGNIFMLKKTLTTTTTGGSGVALPLLFIDEDFNRGDSNILGNSWIEIDSDPSAEAQILNNRLDFKALDDDHQPLIYTTFTQQTTGKIRWSFTFNFERTGSEGTYEMFMQLGQGLTNAPTGDTTGVAVNLKWGGTNNGFSNHEGFGYYNGVTVTQVAIVSGDAGSNSGGDATIEVIADLDAKTFDLTISGAGFISGSGTTTSIPFDNSLNIDTIMLYLNGINESNFGDLEIDNIIIEQAP